MKSDNYEKLFLALKQFEPSEKLRAGILAKINLAKKRAFRAKLAFFGTMSAVSLSAIIPSFQYATLRFSQSGFYRYFSLIFSDGGTIIHSWKEFILSLAESLPFLEVSIFLATVFVFLICVRSVIRNIYPDYKFNPN